MPKKPKSAEQPISPSLQQLRDQYQDHPALQEEAIYALPRGLITEIEKEKRIFTGKEAQFEMDLAKASGGGYFLGEPFGYLSLSKPPVGEMDAELDERNAAAVSSIKQMLGEDRIAAGFSPKAVNAAMRPDPKTDQKILERREGYAGWLVTSADFRKQRDAICQAFRSEVTKFGRFPPYIPSAMGEAPNVPKEQIEFFWNFMEFYETWGLNTMMTWDLPVPMRPQWTSASGYHLPQISDSAGLVVFIPWHLLRHKDLKIEDIVERKKVTSSPPEIREWLEGKPKNWGTDRFAMMLRIYIYLELALKRRYPEKIKGNQGMLDVAFSRFLSKDLDGQATGRGTIEKTRLMMTKRLCLG